MHFAKENYKNIIEINFVFQKNYKDIFDDGFEVDTIVRNITFKNPDYVFEDGNTLIFFDELQACPNAATSLKSYKLDGRYDVICSGSLMGIHYKEIESNSVGFKEDYNMYSLDFEEFMWAKGYKPEHIEELYSHMIECKPLPNSVFNAVMEVFREYMVLGGMPKVVATFVEQNNYSNTLELQKQLLIDYEEDITKYAEGLDQAKILNIYRHIPIFLAKDNKKFQISKIGKNTRNRNYVGTIEWLTDAGIINVCHSINIPELPLKGNYDSKDY
ncbi:MAG: AAA family ATPase, partial [Lachnospiraceae bacterium]|nr:AAA family ATPase [Lachnospiraceae bacterium]